MAATLGARPDPTPFSRPAATPLPPAHASSSSSANHHRAHPGPGSTTSSSSALLAPSRSPGSSFRSQATSASSSAMLSDHTHRDLDRDLMPPPQIPDDDDGAANDSDCEDLHDGVGLGAALDEAQNKSAGPGGPDGDAASSPTDSTKKKKIKKRNRKPSSCGPCRRKKLRCDRQSPCGACVLRGEPHLCSWEDAVPLRVPLPLREQVDRLQGLVDILVRTPHMYPNPAISAPPSYNSPSEYSELSGSMNLLGAPSRRDRDRQSSLSQFEHTDEQIDWSADGSNLGAASDRHDLKGSDLAEALSHLAITHVTGKSETIRAASVISDGPVRLDDAKAFLNLPSQFGLAEDPFLDSTTAYPGPGASAAHNPTPGGSRFRPSRATTEKLSSLPSATAPSGGLASVLSAMPTTQQAQSALGYYTRYVDWYLHPIHLPTFRRQWDAMQRWTPGEEDPFFLATYLAVVGIGVAMQPSARAARDGLGTPQQRDELADRFLQGSMTALTVGQFLDKPSPEAIRALLVINTHYVFMDSGEHTGSGMGLLSLAVQIALQLGLHRDPDKTPGMFDPVQTEDRRRLFWTLCSFECLASSALGRTYSIFNLDNVDTKFPRDLDDDEITTAGVARRPRAPTNPSAPRETVMTSLLIRMRIGVIAKRISDRAFGIRAVSYATVMELDRELRRLERDLPTHYQLKYDEPSGTFALPAAGAHITSLRFYMIHISLQQEYMRLHRPFLVKATTSSEMAESRAICVRAARVILAIQRQPPMQSDWAGLLYKSISAAIVLAIDILQDPMSPYSNVYRAEIQAILVTLNQFSKTSTLCRKGAKVVMFLLQRDQTNRREQELHRTKRARPSGANGVGTADLFPASNANLQNGYASSSGSYAPGMYSAVQGSQRGSQSQSEPEEDTRPRKVPAGQRPQAQQQPSPTATLSSVGNQSHSSPAGTSQAPVYAADAGGLSVQIPAMPVHQNDWLGDFTAASSGFGSNPNPSGSSSAEGVGGPNASYASIQEALLAAHNIGIFAQSSAPNAQAVAYRPTFQNGSMHNPVDVVPPAPYDSVPASSLPEPLEMPGASSGVSHAAGAGTAAEGAGTTGLPVTYDFNFDPLMAASGAPPASMTVSNGASSHGGLDGTGIATVGGDYAYLESMGIIGGLGANGPPATNWSNLWSGGAGSSSQTTAPQAQRHV